VPRPLFDPFRFSRPARITQQERARMIAETAYFLAESRNFALGHEVEDWLRAEVMVDLSLIGAAPIKA
jgi:DICT domain-containing protein